MVDINLLRDTQDPELESQRPGRIRPPKLSDLESKTPKGPKPTSRGPRSTVGQVLRQFFGIKPRAPKPKATPKPVGRSGLGDRPSAAVPFRSPSPSGAPPTNIPPRPEEFTISPRREPIAPPHPEAPIRGDKAMEDLFGEPTVLGTPAAPIRPAPPPPPRAGAPVPPPVAVPKPPRVEDLFDEAKLEDEPPGTVAPAPKPPLPPAPQTVPPPIPPELRRPTGTRFEPLPVGAGIARPVVKRQAPVGRIVDRKGESFWARVLRIGTSILPARREKLPLGEGPEDLDVNLVPEELSAKLNATDKMISLALVALAASTVVAIAYTVLKVVESNIVVRKEAIITDIDGIRARTVSVQSDQRSAIAFKQRADAVAFALGNHVRWSRFFDSLGKYTEKDVYFVNFAGDLTGNITLAAFGKSYESVARQYTTFNNAKDFVQTVSIAGATQAENGSTSFTVALQLIPTFYLAPAETVLPQ